MWVNSGLFYCVNILLTIHAFLIVVKRRIFFLLREFESLVAKAVVFWLVNTISSKNKTNHDMWGNSYTYRKSIYKKETFSCKNIVLVIE